jgi:hypothetical protein
MMLLDAQCWMLKSGGHEKEQGAVRPFLLERKGPKEIGDF